VSEPFNTRPLYIFMRLLKELKPNHELSYRASELCRGFPDGKVQL
jgi:hypothetical protein